MIFVSILGWLSWWICVLFLMSFWYLSRSHMQPSKPSKTIVSPMNFNDFTMQRNVIFDDFPALFLNQFWHWFSMSLGIDSGSLLGPLWHQIPCFWMIVFWLILSPCFLDCWSRKGSKKRGCMIRFSVRFRIILPHTCTFYKRKTYKWQKPYFPNI